MSEDLSERALALLKTDEPTTTAAIADQLGVKLSTASRLVTKLRAAGKATTRRGPPKHGGGVYAAA